MIGLNDYQKSIKIKTHLREADVSYETIFIIWTAIGSFIIITKLILFSPKKLPAVITNDRPYSLIENSFPLKLCQKQKKVTVEKSASTNVNRKEHTSFLALFKDIKLWLIWIAFNAFSLRLGKFK